MLRLLFTKATIISIQSFFIVLFHLLKLDAGKSFCDTQPHPHASLLPPSPERSRRLRSTPHTPLYSGRPFSYNPILFLVKELGWFDWAWFPEEKKLKILLKHSWFHILSFTNLSRTRIFHRWTWKSKGIGLILEEWFHFETWKVRLFCNPGVSLPAGSMTIS